MKCDQCDQEATVHELRVVNGKKVERHLCQKCARTHGIDVQPTLSVPEQIEKYLLHAAQAGAKTSAGGGAGGGAAKPAACPTCGTTYVEFRKTGLLGCPDCYRGFEAQLGPLLERAHEGGMHHVGKVPRRALSGGREGLGKEAGGTARAVLGDAAQRAGRIAALRKQLDEAVRAEQYERAATLRDELRKLTQLERQA